MPHFQLSLKAYEDLKAIGRYTLKAWGRDQRNKYLSKLDACFHFLAEHPESGMQCDYIRTGYRMHHIGKHLIFYRTNQNTIEIIRVLHESMDIKSHL